MNTKELTAELLKIFGAAAAFRMLDVDSATPRDEIQAAKDTGEIVRGSIHDLIVKLRGV